MLKIRHNKNLKYRGNVKKVISEKLLSVYIYFTIHRKSLMRHKNKKDPGVKAAREELESIIDQIPPDILIDLERMFPCWEDVEKAYIEVNPNFKYHFDWEKKFPLGFGQAKTLLQDLIYSYKSSKLKYAQAYTQTMAVRGLSKEVQASKERYQSGSFIDFGEKWTPNAARRWYSKNNWFFETYPGLGRFSSLFSRNILVQILLYSNSVPLFSLLFKLWASVLDISVLSGFP